MTTRFFFVLNRCFKCVIIILLTLVSKMVLEKTYVHSGLYKTSPKSFDTNVNRFLLFLIIITVLTQMALY
jgi:hypothetical protein